MRRVGLVCLLYAAPAAAESINVNFAPPGHTPAATFAAAGDAGTWNTVTGIAGTTFHLVATDGSPSGVTLSQTPTTTLLATSDPSLAGDDAILLDNGLVTSGAETCLSFEGVAPGDYEVLIYAWLPDQPSVKSRTRQDEAPSTIDVGGSWSGAQTEGVTYASYMVTVGRDGTLPAHSGLVPGAPAAALNAIQIRLLGGTGSGSGSGSSGGGSGGNDPPPMGGGCTTGGSASLPLALALLVLRRRR